MRPTPHPVQKESIIRECSKVVGSHPAVAQIEAELTQKIAEILNTINTKTIQTQRALCTRTNQQAIKSIEGFSQEDPALKDALNELYQDIRKTITRLFYGVYIEECLTTLLIPYCEKHKAPKKWGIGSVFYFDDVWGRAFYSFWRSNIEKDGDDEFKHDVVDRLPDEWKKTYEMKNKSRKCPYEWNTLSDEALVQTLVSLKKKTDPSQEKWWIGSIATAWVDPNDDKNLWGKSFWHYWRTNIEEDDDTVFRERLLPHFPAEMQNNFEQRKVRSWKEMTIPEIATLLNTARKPTKSPWIFWDIEEWILEGNDEKSQGFTLFWMRTENYMDKFQNEILPLLKPSLRKSYRSIRGQPFKGIKEQLEQTHYDRIRMLEESNNITVPEGAPVFMFDGEEVLRVNIADYRILTQKVLGTFNGTQVPTSCLLFMGKRRGRYMFTDLSDSDASSIRLIEKPFTVTL